MVAWKVGQKIICDRKSVEAYILELNETNSAIFVTLYHPKLGFSVSCNIEMLALYGWRVSTEN